ncbi:enolase-phosphatase E1-like isoform X3 [Macrobrachium rosenbergii]|uniref:enolase-phosphatase E1-like isoform X3 n=1 Tax=Macrobrachium rosenbergii TaxID=79674 RepID=UPI0034D6273F
MSGGGITAAGLIVLLLALIGLGVGLYYAYICLRARPVRPRQHTDCEDGPLIALDPDVNGNHEDVPVEASAPVDDESDAKSKLIPDGKSKVESNGSVEGIPNGPTKEKDAVLVPIEEKPEPVKLIVEDETAPVLNMAPAGFVVPVKEVAEDGSPIHHQTPKKVEFAKQEKAEPEVHRPIHSPVPIFVPVPSVVSKKPVTDSDEEDGLLLQKCTPHDDSLERETGSEPPAVPSSENAAQKVLASAPPADCEPVSNSIRNESLTNLTPEEIVCDKPEVKETIDENIISEVVPELENSLPLTKEPEIVPPAEVDKETVQVTSPVLMKEEIENLSDVSQPVSKVCDSPEPGNKPPASDISNPPAAAVEQVLIESDLRKVDDHLIEEPEGASQESVPDTVVQLQDEKSMEKEPKSVVESESDSSSENSVEETEISAVTQEITITEPEITKAVPEIVIKEPVLLNPEISSEEPDSNDYPDVVYLKTSVPYEDDKESEVNSDISSKDQPSFPNLKGEDKSLEEMAAYVGENLEEKAAEECENLEEKAAEECENLEEKAAEACENLEEKAAEECENLEEKAAEECGILEEKAAEECENLEEKAAEGCENLGKKAAEAKLATDSLTSSKSQVMPEVSKEDNKEMPEITVTPVAPVSAAEHVPVSLQSEDKMEPKIDEPLELPVTSEVTLDAPLEAETYYSDSVDEDNALEIIKEEGSIDTELESNSDTETSEPEVTQYTFACGPLVPSTKAILADELSSTLEPQVTKFSVLSDDLNLGLERQDERVAQVNPTKVLDEQDLVTAEKRSPNPDKEDSDFEDSDTETEDYTSELDKKLDNKATNKGRAGEATNVGQLPVLGTTNKDEESSGTETEEESESDQESVKVPTVQDQPVTSFQLDGSNANAEDKKVRESEKVAIKEAEKEALAASPSSQGEQNVSSSSVDVPLTLGPGENETKVPESSKDPTDSCKEIPQVTVVNIQDVSSTSLSNSSSLSSSSTSDLSDDEMTLPNSQKSKIPRLVERHGS